MKKFVVMLSAALTMCATIAMAAAPAAPVFNAPVKVSDGKIRNPNNKVAVDGTTVYAAYEDYTLGVNSPFHVGKSSNNGATWGLSAIPDSTSAGVAIVVRVAVGVDPIYTGNKLVHTVWMNETGDVMYSYFATRPNQTGWSTPVRINGSYIAANNELDVVATSNGAVHVLIENQYTTASSPDSYFTEPVALPATGLGSLVKDSKDNLYAAVSDGINVSFTKKAAGSTTWSAPVTVTAAGTSVSGYISIAVANANTIYIGYADRTTSGVKLAVTTNGGATWTRRSVLALPAGFETDVAIAVTSTKILTLVTRTGDSPTGGYILKVVRTNDNGVTWSAPVQIQADNDPTITLDASNKAMIIVRDGQQGEDWTGVRTNTNANLLFIKEK